MGGASSAPARETPRADEQACDAGGKSKRRSEHCVPDDDQNSRGGDGSCMRSCETGGTSSSVVGYNGDELACSDEATQSLLFSCNPRAASSGNVQAHSGGRVNVQQLRSFEIDPTRHKIFLSHSGAQKSFVEQLCVDLEAQGYLFPFFDQRHHSLPKGKDFVPLIKQAARLCHVAVIVLSEEFLCSKWPMIELAEFYAAKQGGNDGMQLLPLFYKLSVGDLDERSIEDRWMPKWNEFAGKDRRILVTEWAAAVTALRGVNGLAFGKDTNSEVAYRKEIVQSIWKLSPGELLYDSAREMVGYHRICEGVSKRFVECSEVGASVLGLYGTTGFGKTTLSKAMCDYFAGEFMVRVCHVELGASTRMKRQELMLKTLCGIEEDVLNRVTDDRKGLKVIRDCMSWEPVFLVIDNVTNEESSRREAHEYLTVGFHPRSKIMITARSKEILQDLLPGVRFCMNMPRLNEEEAGMIFLRSAAPMKYFSLLTDEERRIVGLCIRKCLLESDEDEFHVEDEKADNSLLTRYSSHRAYHPLALSAMGDFFYKLSASAEMLRWKDSLEESNELMMDVLQSPSITRILRLQFSTLSSSEQLLFLDIALFTSDWFLLQICSKGSRGFGVVVEWLSALHGETASVIERRLRDLKRSGMIYWGNEYINYFEFRVHSLYVEFAMWYVTQHGVTGSQNVWGVIPPCGTSLGSDHPRSKCISDLVRLGVFHSTRASIGILARKRMHELQNLAMLQLHDCGNVRELSLEALDNLRHLELFGLSKLVEVTMTGRSGSHVDGGIFESLQYVSLEFLDSLTHVPDFRSCTSLRFLGVSHCPKVTYFEGVECPHLRQLLLADLDQHQLGRSPNFRSLNCLRKLSIELGGEVDFFDAMDVHANPNILLQGRHVEGAVRQGRKDSDELSANSDADLYPKDVFEERTIINVHLENHYEKEGLSIVQKVLSYLYQGKWRYPSQFYVHFLRWSFNEGVNEVLYLHGSNFRRRCERVIEWRFKSPRE